MFEANHTAKQTGLKDKKVYFSIANEDDLVCVAVTQCAPVGLDIVSRERWDGESLGAVSEHIEAMMPGMVSWRS